jgi:GcrA cell cycle regulator
MRTGCRPRVTVRIAARETNMKRKLPEQSPARATSAGFSFPETIMTWTSERTEQLKALWMDGQSASAIASELGRVTRNAVIGKVYRLGLAGRPKTSRARRAPCRSTTVRTPRRRAPLASNHPRPVTPDKAASALAGLGPAPRVPVTIATLAADSCRWPEGDPKTPGFHFCGRQKSSPSGPYCEPHAAIAYL